MKTYVLCFLIGVFFICSGCQDKNSSDQPTDKTEAKQDTTEQQEFSIALHGGAGNMQNGQMPDSLEQAYKDKMEEAIKAGHQILKEGGAAMDAVQATINIMEDSPLFNSGKGAVLNHKEKPELDASVMDGKTLNAGAIAGVKHIKNPVDLAIEVMNHSNHVMLAGEGAEVFALERDFDTVPESYFITDKRLDDIKRIKKEEEQKTASLYNSDLKADKMGTVGSVALDKEGNLAAGTSTGGIANKRYGRIGDSPIIGAGTYANNKTCAVSSTGQGEYFIRGTVAYDISALMEYKNRTVAEAAKKVIQEKQPDLGGTGGVIAIDAQGHITQEFNTAGMFRATMDDEGQIELKIYKDSE